MSQFPSSPPPSTPNGQPGPGGFGQASSPVPPAGAHSASAPMPPAPGQPGGPNASFPAPPQGQPMGQGNGQQFQPGPPQGNGQQFQPGPPQGNFPAGSAPYHQGMPNQQQGPGLFDTTFAQTNTHSTGKLAFIAVIVLASLYALAGLLLAIGNFSNAEYIGVSAVLSGLSELLVHGAVAFLLVTLGRLVIEYFIQEDIKRKQK